MDPETLLNRRQAAEALSAAGYPIRPTTLACMATRGGSPRFRRFGRRPLYRWGDLLEWANSRFLSPDELNKRGGRVMTKSAWAFEWSASGETKPLSIDQIYLLRWLRRKVCTNWVIGFADVQFRRQDVRRCRLRWVTDHLRVECASDDIVVQWREVNIAFASIIVKLIVIVDPEIRTPRYEVPHIPPLSTLWGGTMTGPDPTQDQILIGLARQAELFQDPDGTAYADLTVNGHRETYPVQGNDFKQWLRRGYYKLKNGAPNSEAMKVALATIEAQAQFDGPMRSVHVRVGAVTARFILILPIRCGVLSRSTATDGG